MPWWADIVTGAQERPEAPKLFEKTGGVLARPRLLSILFRPHNPYDASRRLFRCKCGDLFWEDSPQDIQARHGGHRIEYAVGGSFWEWIKIKAGWIP
jgi:hypothetical protein